MISDEEIINAFRKSYNEGYKLLVDCYVNYVYTIVSEKVGGLATEEDKEECIADIFIETIKECRAYDFTMKSFKSVIIVVSKRKAIDLFRKLRYKKEHNEYLEERTDEPVEYNTPESLAEKNSETRRLWQEVVKLGNPDSDIIILQFFHNKQIKDIAKILNMSTVAVNKRSQRARKKLKSIFLEREYA